MKQLIICWCLVFTGCSTAVPVTAQFPEPPEQAGAYKTCIALKQLNETPALSEVSRTIAENYAAYHECRLKLNIWLEWYQIQKALFEKAGR